MLFRSATEVEEDAATAAAEVRGPLNFLGGMAARSGANGEKWRELRDGRGYVEEDGGRIGAQREKGEGKTPHLADKAGPRRLLPPQAEPGQLGLAWERRR